MKRITRDRKLMPDEAARYNAMREQIKNELPELIARHHERMNPMASERKDLDSPARDDARSKANSRRTYPGIKGNDETMINEAEPIYQRIADAIQSSIHEPWTSGKLEALFYPEASTYFSEYLRASDGVARSLEGDTFDAERAIRELRRKFKDEEKPLWGRFCFLLQPDGTFNVHFGYDDIDLNGDARYDKEEEAKRQKERFFRLSSK
jgi:hypothetical protein